MKNHHTERFVVFCKVIRFKWLFVSIKPRKVLNVIDVPFVVSALGAIVVSAIVNFLLVAGY